MPMLPMHIMKNPTAYTITQQIVDSKMILKLTLAPGGGCAISIKPIKAKGLISPFCFLYKC
jgi:hypothetical protein